MLTGNVQHGYETHACTAWCLAISVEPHAMRFHVDQRVKVEELLTHPEWVSRVPSAFVTEFL